jgi:hypothetical protein
MRASCDNEDNATLWHVVDLAVICVPSRDAAMAQLVIVQLRIDYGPLQ